MWATGYFHGKEDGSKEWVVKQPLPTWEAVCVEVKRLWETGAYPWFSPDGGKNWFMVDKPLRD